MSLTWFWCLYWWLWTGLTRCSNVALNKEMSAWLFCCSLHKIVREYKNTTRVDLPEVDFSFHEDNHKVKEMTEVTSRYHEASFIETYHPPRFMSRKFIKEVNGNEGGHGKSWKSFPWPYGYLHGKKNPLQVSLPSWYVCIPFQITLGQKMTEDLKDINLGGCR